MVCGCPGNSAGVEGELSHLPWVTSSWQDYVDLEVAHATPKGQLWPEDKTHGSTRGRFAGVVGTWLWRAPSTNPSWCVWLQIPSL